jgi:ABC-2 type transport system ATP-binding protein
MSGGGRLAPKKRIAARRPSDPGAAAPAAEADDERAESPRIRARSLTKNYGDLVAVDHLNLEVFPGEIFGLLGQNGAGKTTTILMLLGLTEPTGGEARVVGLDPARHPLEVKRRVGYMPDSVGFYGDLTGRENLRYTARLNRIPSDITEDTIDEVLEQVGLADRGDDTVETYSRGMLQRLGIADALVKDPDVLILDEPTTAIDPLGVTEILELLRRLVDERQLAILLSSHLLNQVQSVCDRIGIFSRGRLIGHGTIADLSERFGDGMAHVDVEIEPGPDADVAGLGRRLAEIDGVVAVEGSDDGGRWTLSVKPMTMERQVRTEIAKLSAREGIPLVSLGLRHPSLEDIYRRAVARFGASPEGAVA